MIASYIIAFHVTIYERILHGDCMHNITSLVIIEEEEIMGLSLSQLCKQCTFLLKGIEVHKGISLTGSFKSRIDSYLSIGSHLPLKALILLENRLTYQISPIKQFYLLPERVDNNLTQVPQNVNFTHLALCAWPQWDA